MTVRNYVEFWVEQLKNYFGVIIFCLGFGSYSTPNRSTANNTVYFSKLFGHD